MAEADPIMGASNDASEFIVNGCTPFIGPDPRHYVVAAHGIIAFLNVMIQESGDVDHLPPNNQITAAVLDGVELLLAHAVLDLQLAERERHIAAVAARSH